MCIYICIYMMNYITVHMLRFYNNVFCNEIMFIDRMDLLMHFYEK